MNPASSSSMISINAHNLAVAYESFVALQCEELNLKGQIIGVIGHNGAGKSTFIKSILRLLPPTSGTLEISYANNPILPESDMAFCPETGSVFADISVESYVKLWCRIKHADSLHYRRQGRQYIELLGLDPLMLKLGRELSKGQRRRVQTAIGFLTNPKLFLFDEPFDGLDVLRTRELADLILAHREKMGFLISSHRMDVMERIADVIIVLKEGKFVTYGPVEKICRDLAGQCFLIKQRDEDGNLQNLLQKQFPKALVNRIGNQISVTGRELSHSNLIGLLSKHVGSDVAVEEVRPQLIEAMNYYLQS